MRLLHFKVFLIWILFFSTLLNAEEMLTVHDKKILILHSYHQGLTWTDGQDHGIRDILGRRQDIDIYTEYLDSKRTSLEDISEPFFDFLARKYATTTFDAIIVSDNNALTFLSRYHKILFPDIPVVFCGINNYQPEMLNGFDGLVTGVIQTLDPKGTLDLIQKLQPSVETIVIVSGTTATAWAIRQKVYSEFTYLKESLDTVWLDGLETNDLINRLSGLSRNHAVLLCNFNRDAKGNYYSHEQSARMISKASKAPVYAMEDHYLGTGVTGGYMNSSKDQGIAAGRICLEILKTGKIPEVVMASPNAIMFDYKAMSRFGLDASILPRSAIIVNRPVSFYEQYKTLIWNTVAAFCMLLLAFLGVSFGLVRARQAERKVRRNEENLHTTLNSIGDAVIATDTEGCIVRMNPVAEKLTGMELVEAKGKPLTEVFHIINAQTKESAVNPVKRVLETGKIVGLANHTMLIAKNGFECQIADSAAPIFNDEGIIIGVVLVFRDVTEEYQMQEALRESEEKYRSFLETSPDAIAVFNADGEIVLANFRMEEMFGYSQQELLGKVVESLIPERFRDIHVKHREGFFAEPVPMSMGHGRRAVALCENGTEIPVDISLGPLQTKEGLLVAASIRDITESTRAEQALETEKNRLAKSQGIGSIGTWELDLVENVLTWTKENHNIFAIPDGIDMTYETFLDCAYPDDRGYINTEWMAALNGKPYDIEHRIIANGKVKWVREKAELLFDDKGQAIRAVGVTQDITKYKKVEKALQESESRFRDFFANAPIGFHIFGPNQTIIDINDAELDMIGYTRDEIVSKKTWSDLVIPAQAEQLKKHWNEIITSGSVRNLEYTLVHKQGHHVNVLLNASSRFDEIGQFVNSRGSILDITNRKRAEAEREKFLRTLTAKNKELQSVVYIASHDLKSPLVNISGFSAEIDQSCKDITKIFKELDVSDEVKQRILPIIYEDLPESIKFISAGIHKMKMLLDGLLQVSRVGTMDIDIEPLNVNGIVKNVCKAMKFQFKEKDVDVNFDDLPGCLGDEKMIDQVFSNLIGNALKYLYPDKKGKIDITGTVEGSQSVYCVQDNGVGIHPDHQSKVFEIFHRLNPDDSAGGEGLGLTIITRILDRNNGTIRVESEPGKGSKFFVSLPKP